MCKKGLLEECDVKTHKIWQHPHQGCVGCTVLQWEDVEDAVYDIYSPWEG